MPKQFHFYCLLILFTVRVLQGRETSGPLQRRHVIPTRLYAKQQQFRRTLGHLSAVYCLLFDRSGRYVITVSELNYKLLARTNTPTKWQSFHLEL